jgi:hypothetical protein
MPFIRGRYHINPVMGQALEAARQAEAALAALEQRARQNSGSDHSGDNSGADSNGDDATGFRSAQDPATKGPVHRVEIEATEVVPNHSGRGQRGFVARIHHAPTVPDASANATNDTDGDADDWRDQGSSSAAALAPETHVFADHGDLVDFLRDALSRDADR